MTLERCPSCRRMIASSAESCPKCGQALSADLWRQTRRKRSRIRIGSLAVVVAVGASLALAASGTGIKVTALGYGTDWPFPAYDVGVIRCQNQDFGGVIRPVVTISLGGIQYGVNGAAMGVAGYPDVRTLLRTDPVTDAYVMGAISEFLRSGLELCSR